jgi:eukaryotic translation initiation factor 2C
LKYPELPLVNCGNRDNPMYLPAEVCVVLPGQPSKSKLDGTQTQQMIRHAVRKPWENAASIVGEGLATVGLDENSNALLVHILITIKVDMLNLYSILLV